MSSRTFVEFGALLHKKSLWLLLLPLYIENLSTYEHFQVGSGVPDFRDFKEKTKEVASEIYS